MKRCILCGAGAVLNRQDSGSRTIYNCPICGTYVVSDLAMDDIKKYMPQISAFLAARNLNRLSDTVLISFDNASHDKDYVQLTVPQIVGQFPRSYSEAMDRTLLNLAILSGYPGGEVKVDSLDSAPYFYLTQVNYDALSYAIKALQKAEYCDVSFYGSAFFPCGIVLSPQGWDRVAKLQSSETDRQSALLVLNRTDDPWSGILRLTARKAVEDCGFQSVESSLISADNQVGYSFITHVKSSRLVLCDLSSSDFGSGYYAAAFAQALGKTVALTCHQSQKNKLKINTDEIGVLFWKGKNDLYNTLYNMIRATTCP